MKTKYIITITLISLLAFSFSLGNDFVGDDEVLIVNNEFYQSPEHLKHLFSKHYLSDSRDYFIGQNVFFNSGSISYRPVTSIGFFIDKVIWGNNPFGYHLSSLFVHLLNAVLVFILIFIVLGSGPLAFFSAMIFAIHPLKVEPVCAISYRHDLIATCFALVSLIAFVKHIDRKGFKRIALSVISLLAFFFGVFAKESVVVLPIVLVVYLFYFLGRHKEINFRKIFALTWGYFLLLGAYLYVYLKVFPNTTFATKELLGANASEHVVSVLWIFANNVYYLIFPFRVNMLPALYKPEIFPMEGVKAFCGLVLLSGICFYIFKTRKSRTASSFFLLFFMVAMLPVLNIIPNDNPMAHRFLYFPSIGILTFIVIQIENFSKRLIQSGKFSYIDKVIRWSVILLCLSVTVPLSQLWKNNLLIASSWTENYPKDPKGYTILGIEYYKQGHYEAAKDPLIKSLHLGSRDPRIYYMLGEIEFENTSESIDRYYRALHYAPEYYAPYIGLGRHLLKDGRYKQANYLFYKSIQFQPSYDAYKYLIYSLKKSGNNERAQKVFRKAEAQLKNQQALDRLSKLLKEQRHY